MLPDESKIIIIDDDKDNTYLLKEFILCNIQKSKVFEAHTVATGFSLVQQESPHVAVVDLNITQSEGPQSGLELVKNILKYDSSTRIIILTGHSISEYGLKALEIGAASYLEKPVDLRHFIALTKDSINTAKLKRELIDLRTTQTANIASELQIASNLAKNVIDQIELAIISDLPVLITGETGTGKGTVAKLIHRLSTHNKNRFVRYQPNFASSDHINSELFGHIKNAFTGANSARNGLILEAHKGTLFLDEINEFPLETQALLLDVLQEKRFRQVGADNETISEFRLISAMNKNPVDEISQQKLREDLFYRISKLVIMLPPLRDGVFNIRALTYNFLETIASQNNSPTPEISENGFKKIISYSWPGNIRELEAVVQKAFWNSKLNNSVVITENDLHLYTKKEAPHQAMPVFLPMSLSPTQQESIKPFNQQILEYKKKIASETLLLNNGNYLKTARSLGVDRGTLSKIVKL